MTLTHVDVGKRPLSNLNVRQSQAGNIFTFPDIVSPQTAFVSLRYQGFFSRNFNLVLERLRLKQEGEG